MRLGADPEVFIMSGKSVLSSIGRVGGTKESPLQVPSLPTGFTVQEDNVAVEFGIPPCSTALEFQTAISIIREHALSMVKRKDTDPKYPLKFTHLSCTVFPKTQLKHPASHIFGCEPDFNAWTGEKNSPPTPPVPGMRSAGGHIHIETTLDPRKVAQALDVTIGCATVILDKHGAVRQSIGYGRAGSYRPKPYGLEYRVPSNFWIFKNDFVFSMWHRAECAISMVESEVNLSQLGKRIQGIINNSDSFAAKKMLQRFGIHIGAFEGIYCAS